MKKSKSPAAKCVFLLLQKEKTKESERVHERKRPEELNTFNATYYTQFDSCLYYSNSQGSNSDYLSRLAFQRQLQGVSC